MNRAPSPRLHARRKYGRPVRAPGHDPREALLDGAVALFAERGVGATTSSDIAARAGVTPAMIHYYFRSRERLIDAVVDERLARFIAHVWGTPFPPPAPLSGVVATIVGRIFEAARLMPWMPPIWIREIAAENGVLRERALKHLPLSAIAGFVALLRGAQSHGQIAEGIEPSVAFVSIIGLTLFPLATQPVWRRFPGADRLTVDDLQRHAATVLTSGLTGGAGKRATRTPRSIR